MKVLSNNYKGNTNIVLIFSAYLLVQFLFAIIYYQINQVHNGWYYSDKTIIAENIKNRYAENEIYKNKIGIKVDSLKDLKKKLNVSLNYIRFQTPIEITTSLKKGSIKIDSTDCYLNSEDIEYNIPIRIDFTYYRIAHEKFKILSLTNSRRDTLIRFKYQTDDLLINEIEEELSEEISKVNIDISDLEISLKDIDNELTNLNNQLESPEYKNIWNFADFFYFTFAFVNSQDIVPNHTIIRILIVIQRIIELVLLFVLVNMKRVRV
jgi:hypothetical protein